jgi:3-methyladenine DNA glycosylase AlkD
MVNKVARKAAKATKPRQKAAKRALTKDEVLARMEAHADPDAVAGKARYGIVVTQAFGVSLPFIRALAKEIGTDHTLARSLWATAIPECRLLAPMIADPDQTDDRLLERWVADLESWDVCDGFCAGLVVRLPSAWDKAIEWSKRDEEFVRRAGFATMATLAVHAKDAPDKAFRPLLKRIEAGAGDARNFVKKAVNWALRQIGKRNAALHAEAVACAERILDQDTPAARWVARDALKELQDPVQRARIKAKGA